MPTGNKSFCPPVSTSTPHSPLPPSRDDKPRLLLSTHPLHLHHHQHCQRHPHQHHRCPYHDHQVAGTKTLLLQAFVLARWNECAAAKKKCPTLMLGLNRASTHHNGPAGHYRERGVSLQKMRWQSLIPGQLCPPSGQTVSLLLLCHCTSTSIH